MTPLPVARGYLEGEGRVLDLMIQFDTMMADCFLADYVHLRFSLKKLKRAFTRWQKGLAKSGWNALYLENHDHPRVIDRYGSRKFWRESGTMLAACILFQRGTPFIYQGQELGMTNIKLPSIGEYLDVVSINAYHRFHLREPEEKRLHRIHVSSRDSARTPVQWTPGKNAGFSEHEPWFYVNPNYKEINAETERKDPYSILNFYRKCLRLRKQSAALLWGSYREYARQSRKLYVYERTYGEERILVICSFSKQPLRFHLPGAFRGQEAKVILDNYPKKDRLENDGAVHWLQPYEVRVLKARFSG